MRIRAFSHFIKENLEPYKLNNTTVVIDGQNFFFNMYKDANIPYTFGCESNYFATFIRTNLEKFIKANVTLYFVFKGGHEDRKSLKRHFEAGNRLHGRDYVVINTYDEIVKPIFAKDIIFEVLDEMGLEYVISDDNEITECIALAQKLSCPLISFNIQYFFSNVQYIPFTSIELNDQNLECGIILKSKILKKYDLTEEKMIMFLLLADEHIFEQTCFERFYQHHRMFFKNLKLIKSLLQWLSRRSVEEAEKIILKFLSESDQLKFSEQKADLKNLMLRRNKTESRMTLFVIDKNTAKIIQSDPNWFEKGILLKYIAISYINLYKFKIVKASHFIEDYKQENSVMLSIDIIKYAFDLLTNFQGGEIYVEFRKSASKDEPQQPYKYEHSFPKPTCYNEAICFFENGWGDHIKEFKLFQHFIVESLQTFDFDCLNRAPADSRILLLALVYFSHKRPDVELEIFCVLLSYVLLGVVAEKRRVFSDPNKFKNTITEKPLLDYITDKSSVTDTDCDIAWLIMEEYFKTSLDEMCYTFDRKILHPLVEFQRCLQELNYLNQLCGLPFSGTIYSRTYNGTFVYKTINAVKCNGLDYIKNKLIQAPTVLAFLSGLVEIYESLMYGI